MAVLVYCFAMLWRQARWPVPAHGTLRRIAALVAGPFRWLIRVLLGGLRRGMAGAAMFARQLSLGMSI